MPTSIAISIGSDPKDPENPDLKNRQMLHVGDLNFTDPNSGVLQGRQFQTIEFQGNDKLKVNFVMLSLKHNYMHKKNDLNQVSLMGISIHGQMKPPMIGKSPNSSRRGSRTDDFIEVPRRQDLAFLMYTDKDVAEVCILNVFNTELKLACNSRASHNVIRRN